MVEDAAEDAAIGDEGDHARDALAAGTDERVDSVHPATELGPSTAKGGLRGGPRGRRRMGLRMNARPRRERRALPSMAASLQPPARDVGVGAVVVDEVPSRVGNVREETGDEVEGVERHGFVVAVAFPGQVRGGL